MFSISKNYISTCHCHLSSRFLIIWRLSSCCFPFSPSFLPVIESNLADELCKIISKAQSLYVKKRLANAVQKNITDFFNAKWLNNKELSLNTLLYVSVRYTCYCSVMLLLGNCIIVCHMFLELYSLYCNDLCCPLCTSKTCLGQFWFKEHLIPSMEPLKWRNIHDLYTTDTSLIRTLCSVPSVSVLERFDCSSKYINLSSL